MGRLEGVFVVSQLVTLMDGLKSRAHVIVMGVTNRQNTR